MLLLSLNIATIFCTTQNDDHSETHTIDASSMTHRRNHRFVGNKCQNYPTNSVINLFNTNLTVPQERLLSRGLNYVMKPSAPNQQRLQQDLKVFYTRPRLREHFADSQTDYDPDDKQCKFCKKVRGIHPHKVPHLKPSSRQLIRT